MKFHISVLHQFLTRRQLDKLNQLRILTKLSQVGWFKREKQRR
jgi:hypothetical protein